jgi:RNA polymerase sigma factor (sigma-70 family)
VSGMIATVAAYTGDDNDLVAGVRRGDDRAFEELYQRYHARIAAYVRGMVKDHARAEDVTQEVFLSALRRMRQTERAIVFKPWIYEIARNACIDAYRRTSRAEELSYDAEGALSGDDTLRLVSSGPAPDAAVESKQQLDDLCGAFGGLSETHHQILVLRELEGLSYREIGERLGMSRPAVESTLFRARRRLSEEYDELVSGRRCERVQKIIAAAAEGMLGARDRRKLARHVTTCHSCRCHARRMGLDEHLNEPKLSAKLAALLPIPVFLRRGRGDDPSAVAGGHGSGLAAQVSSTLGAAADPVAATWSKAAAALAALTFAGAGAGVAAKNDVPLPGPSDVPIVRALKGGETKAGRATLTSPARAVQALGTDKSGAARGGTASTTTPRGNGAGGGSAATAPRQAGGNGHAAGTGGGAAGTNVPSLPGQHAPEVNVPRLGGSGGGPGAGARPSAPEQPQTTDSPSAPSVQAPTVSLPTEVPSAPEPQVDVQQTVASVTGS